MFICCCGFTSTSSGSVGTHKRYCNGEVPAEHQRKHRCDKCIFTSDTINHLQVDLSSKHPYIRNEQLKRKKNFAWTEPVLEFLAATIIRLKKEGVRKVNEVASSLLTDRTVVAIQAIHTKTEYKQAERRIREREQSKASPNSRTTETDRNLVEGASKDNDLSQLLMTDVDQQLEIVIIPPTETPEGDNSRATDQTQSTNSVRQPHSNNNVETDIHRTNGSETQEFEYHKDALTAVSEFVAIKTPQNHIDHIVDQYLKGETSWAEVAKELTTEKVSRPKVDREGKGPWMRNRRENRNTRKARIYRFTQRSYRQNRKATISKILEGTLNLDNESNVTPPISAVEKVYTDRLEIGNQLDNSIIDHLPPQYSSQYGRIRSQNLQRGDEQKNSLRTRLSGNGRVETTQ